MSAFDLMVRVFELTATGIAYYVAAINILYLFLMVLGFFALWRDRRMLSRAQQDALLRSPMLPPFGSAEHGPSSHSIPSHRRPSKITWTASCVFLASSVSSMRRIKVPPVCRA